ncbi:hypothetical protein B4N89_27525 [Embleya scabrispora]|uniref:DUF2493 domain-containing protein n=1 Tax=Embleya scabrispora TaxID=159449 RepID=A0A1T3P512_9ACTN|nr:hypothetical protein B4N89_27525 [Embleya scabrispora]
MTPGRDLGAVRVIVMGGRDYEECDVVIRGLVRLRYAHPGATLVVVQGECPTGADRCARTFVTQARARFGWDVEGDPFPADWDSCGDDCPTRPHRVRRHPRDVVHPGVLPTYCPGAGPRRNALMVAAGADIAHAYPTARSRGTYNCMRLASAAGIRVEKFAGPGGDRRPDPGRRLRAGPVRPGRAGGVAAAYRRVVRHDGADQSPGRRVGRGGVGRGVAGRGDRSRADSLGRVQVLSPGAGGTRNLRQNNCQKT